MADSDFEERRRETQQRLLEFLTTDLDLAFTFAGMAQRYRDAGNWEGHGRTLQKARVALEAIRHFEGKIADAEAWGRIHKRADEWEGLLSTISV